MKNCENVVIFELRRVHVCTHERRHKAEFAVLAFHSGAKKRGSFFDMLSDISFEIEFLLESARFIGGNRRSRSSAPKSQFRGH